MSIPTTNFPLVRTITQLVRSLLADDTVGPGFPFVPFSVIVAGGVATATFSSPPGLIPNDTILVAGMTPASLNSSGSALPIILSTGAGQQISWATAAPPGPATVIGTIQGYGTGKKYTDTVLMPYVNSAYRGLQRGLKAAGSAEFKAGNAFVTIPGLSGTDPSANVRLDFTGLTISSDESPAPTFVPPLPVGVLPTDLLVPIKLWEAPTGLNDSFVEMVDLSNTGGLPSRPQGFRLSVFEWAGDGLVFLGAQQSVDIKIRYQRGLPAVSDGSAQLLVLNSEDYHAYAVADMADVARGGREGTDWSTKAEDSKEKLINAAVRGQQSVSRRPRGFSSRRGYANRARVF